MCERGRGFPRESHPAARDAWESVPVEDLLNTL